MRRIFIIVLISLLVWTQIGYGLGQSGNKIVLSREEFLKLNSYIVKLERENKLLREKVQTLQEALDKYREVSLKIEKDLKEELEIIKEQYRLSQDQLKLYEYEIKAKDMEIKKQKVQKILYGLLGIGMGFLLVRVIK